MNSRADMNEAGLQPATVTRLAWFAIAVQVVFIASWLLAGALEDGYSHVEQYVSELGADTAANPWLVNGALLLLGASFAALALGLRTALPPGRWATVAVWLFGACAALFAVAGLFPSECQAVDPSCERRFDAGDLSTATYVHAYSGLALEAALLATPFALARALWPRLAGRLALFAGLAGLAVFAISFAGFAADTDAPGLVQRFGSLAVNNWAVLVALGLIAWSRERRPELVPSEGGPLDPFRYLAGEASGEGEVTYSWWARALRFPRRFRFQRRTTYDGNARWEMDDVLRYENGLTYERHIVARPVSPERMHLTSDAIPGGAETVLVPGGLVLEPAWFIAPYWGIPWPLRCKGLMRAREAGPLEGSFDMALVGVLPVGRMALTLDG